MRKQFQTSATLLLGFHNPGIERIENSTLHNPKSLFNHSQQERGQYVHRNPGHFHRWFLEWFPDQAVNFTLSINYLDSNYSTIIVDIKWPGRKSPRPFYISAAWGIPIVDSRFCGCYDNLKSGEHPRKISISHITKDG